MSRARDSKGVPVTPSIVWLTWWPLVLSWMLMAVEQPVIHATVSRLPDPKVQIAAFGGLVFPMALIVEAPIIMMLSASTALVRDEASYRALRRFMMRISAVLTAIHALVAFTPVFDWVVVGLLEPPVEIREPARLGLQVMLPWTWAIAHRRFNQGVLIAYGRAKSVGAGTAVRLVAGGLALLLTVLADAPGVVVAGSVLGVGVVAEAAFAAWRVHPVVRDEIIGVTKDEPVLRGRDFAAFYVPLALTPFVALAVPSIAVFAISRMPRPLESLAVWPVVNALVFLFQALGLSYNEVVVALMGRPGARATLRRMAWIASAGASLLFALIAFTPAADLWFGDIEGLSPALTDLGASVLWLALPTAGLRILHSWYQGQLVQGRRTRGVTEGVLIFMVVNTAVLGLGVSLGGWPGVAVAIAATGLGRMVEVAWVAYRTRALPPD